MKDKKIRIFLCSGMIMGVVACAGYGISRLNILDKDVATGITQDYLATSRTLTVKYIDENTNQEIFSRVTDATYKDGEHYETSRARVNGYSFTRDSGNVTGTINGQNVEVIYYYKKNSALIVKYVDMYTGEEIFNRVTRPSLQNDQYTTVKENISGYAFKEVQGETSGRIPGDPITITYKYAKLSRVFVEHYDENNGQKLDENPEVIYEEKQSYTTVPNNIIGYTKTGDSGNINGTMQRKDITVKYYYKKNTSVTAKYIDMETGASISPDVTIQGVEGKQFETEQKNISGYAFIEVVGKTNGQMDRNPQEVIYNYKKVSNLITKHIDKNTNANIVDDVIKQYKQGDEYEALGKNITGYEMVEKPESTTGIMDREDVTKTFYYKRISSGLIVKYIDAETGEILIQKNYDGVENDVIPLEELEIINYVLKSKPNYTEVTLGVHPQEVVYEYKKEAHVDVEGIDQDTGVSLWTDTITGIQGEMYKTTPQIVENYTLVREPANKEGTFNNNNSKITYEYKKNIGRVEVKYLDKETGEELGSELINELYGTNYKTVQKEYENYDFDSVEGPTIGLVEEGTKTVTYYYTMKRGKVIVNYEDENGILLSTSTYEEKVGQRFRINVKGFNGYDFVSSPESLEGTYKVETQVLTFVLKEKTDIEYKKGDLNRDGKVNAADATMALEIFKNENATQRDLEIGDMDGRNGINAADATMILEVFKNSNIE